MNEKKPTEKQLAAWHNLTRWALPLDKQKTAFEIIEKHFTRAELSKELGRIRILYIEHRLKDYNVFDAEVWEKHKEELSNAK